jgi:hypothetical protein
VQGDGAVQLGLLELATKRVLATVVVQDSLHLQTRVIF